MIMRVFLLLGLLLLGGTAYFVVVQQPPTFQAVPMVSEVTRLQEEGVLPSGPLAENEEVEHGIFDVPPEDEEMLEAAMANMDMGGMNMDGMNMGSGELDMDMDGDGVMDMSSADMNAGTTMDMGEGTTMETSEGSTMDMGEGTTMETSDGTPMEMAEGSTMEMTGGTTGVLDMDMDGDGVMDMSSADMNSGGTMEMAEGTTMEMPEGGATEMAEGSAMEMAEAQEMNEEEAARLQAGMMAGLVIRNDGAFDREIKLSMKEWGFSDLEIDAKPGERIKFNLRNDGKVLHEFMFMSMGAMQAVNYRAKRADWNLLEHEALYEKSLLLPGEEITFVAQVMKPGVWMFMCMLPYHMQMGMMGQMATEGMAMEM